jgi:hypothetical protein
MPARFKARGLCFQYPENWTLDEEDAAAGRRTVTVYSPGGAFWSVAMYAEGSDPRELAQAAVEAMRQEYADMDVEPADETLADRRLAGYDMNFFCLDLTNSAGVRCLRNGRTTYAVFYQAEDRDFERLAEVFRAITTSLIAELRPLQLDP